MTAEENELRRLLRDRENEKKATDNTNNTKVMILNEVIAPKDNAVNRRKDELFNELNLAKHEDRTHEMKASTEDWLKQTEATTRCRRYRISQE